jgi:methylated-DNA-[protein]-cysteine S-methyltransferase
MRCCDVEALWDDLRDGGEVNRKHVLLHLRSCPPCQQLYEQYEGIAYCLTCLPIVEPPRDLVPKIIEHIEATVRSARKPDCVAKVDSPVGTLYIAFRSTGITAVALDRGEGDESALEQISRRLRRGVVISGAPAWVSETLNTFFRTHLPDYDRVDISDLSPFEQSALRAAAQIPPGEVRSYSWIAEKIGAPNAASAVGRVMARNPVRMLYPCHRVVDAAGHLHNYGYGLDVKARILELEGFVGNVPAMEKARSTQEV